MMQGHGELSKHELIIHNGFSGRLEGAEGRSGGQVLRQWWRGEEPDSGQAAAGRTGLTKTNRGLIEEWTVLHFFNHYGIKKALFLLIV